MFRLLFLLCIFTFKVSANCGNGSAGNYPVSTTGLNELAGQIRTLLQIDSNSGKAQRQPVDDQWTVVPPKYMLDLYHKYADESFILETDPRLTTTVRCVLGKVRRDVVHFNLSSLVDVESVSRAEVHVFRRASRGKTSRTKFSFAQHRLRLRNLPKKFLSTIISLMPSRGWQAVDITSTIKTSLGKAKLLSMTVEASIPEFGTGRARYHTIPVDEVLRVAYRPFLVIFSYSDPLSSSVSSSMLPGSSASSASSSSSFSSSSFPAKLPSLSWDETMPNERKYSADYYRYSYSSSTNPPSIDSYSPLDNHGQNFDELENSLKSILNVDKIGAVVEKNNLADRDLGLENNEISESNPMDHFHFFRSLGLPKSMAEIPLINHSNSVVKKRSIEDNEFSQDRSPSPFHYSNDASSGKHSRQRAQNENSGWNDADDLNLLSNTLTSSSNKRSHAGEDQMDEKELLLRQDNLDNELSPSDMSPAAALSSSSSSPSSIPSSKEGNLNPILPYPWRNRWWNEPSDNYWLPTSSKSRSRRRGGKMNKRKKLRGNRGEKKYWTTRRGPPPPAIPSLVTKSLITDAEALNKAEEAAEETGRRGSNRRMKMANCRVEELSVDTANFDWAERVIAPAVFPLNFCHGSCFHLPKYKEVADSREDRGNIDFEYSTSVISPSPCCSPSRKKRFVVLYTDIHDNIILQIHPNVTTESCLCL